MWSWRGTERISWTDCVRNEGVMRSHEGERCPAYNKKRECNWIGHILHRNCLLKNFSVGERGGNREGKGRRGGRLQQLQDIREERRYWELKEESNRSHCAWNSLWKWLWACRKARLRDDDDVEERLLE